MKLYDFQKEKYKERVLKKLIQAVWNAVRGRKVKNLPTLIILCLCLLIAHFLPSPQREMVTGYATVIDGDTLQINGLKFRLYGIDAPESKQTCQRKSHVYSCGQEATLALESLVLNQLVTCEKEDIDKYNRIVAICRVGEKELNKLMVANGYAVSYRQYTGRYIVDEMKARLNEAGIWSGSFEMPWEYRHKKKQPQ